MADEEEFLEDDDFEDDDLVESGDSEVEVQAEDQVEEDLLLKGFRQYGFEFPEGLDGKTVAANIRAMAQRVQSMPSERELSEMREAKARYHQERESPGEKPEPEQQSALAKPVDAEQYVVWSNEEGMYIPKSKAYPNLPAVEAMNKWHQQVENRRRQLLENPEDYFNSTFKLNEKLESIKKAAKEEALRELNQQLEARRAEEERTKFWEGRVSEIYVTDEKGYVKTDPFTGTPVLNKKGLKFVEFQGEESQKNPNSSPFSWEQSAYARADAWEKSEKRRQSRINKKEADVPDEEVAEQPEPEDVAETQKQAYTKRARAAEESGKRKKGDRVLNRDVSIVNSARNGDAQNGKSDFHELWKSNLKAAGLTQ